MMSSCAWISPLVFCLGYPSLESPQARSAQLAAPFVWPLALGGGSPTLLQLDLLTSLTSLTCLPTLALPPPPACASAPTPSPSRRVNFLTNRGGNVLALALLLLGLEPVES
jgi:hypothetical protein